MTYDDSNIQTSAHITADTTLVPAINAWKVYLEDQGRSPHTVKAFIADLNLLASYLPPDRPLGGISSSDLNLFLEWLQTGRGVPCSPKSLSRRTTSVKSFFRWLQKGGVVLMDPAEKVVQKSVLSPLPKVLSPEEIRNVLAAADVHRTATKPDARPYTLVALLLHTGIKKGETLALNLNHVELKANDGPLLFVRYANPQYRYKERKIPLPDSWVIAYQEYLSQYNPTDQIFPWSPRRLEYLLQDIGKEAALDKQLSFLMCRWSCALTDMHQGMEANKIRQKLGVSKIQWREIHMKLKRLSTEVQDQPPE